MFVQRIKERFDTNEPIFTEEILMLFPEYSRAQIFRYIDKAKQEREIVQYDKGVYYLPKRTRIGLSALTADDVARKKYIGWRGDIYGIIGGIELLNIFSVTTQVPAVIEIVTNKEATRGREVMIKNRKFVIKKSRTEINNRNAAAYTVLQLFDDFGKETELDENASERLSEFIRQQGVTKEQLLNLSVKFPARTMRKLIRSKVFNEIA